MIKTSRMLLNELDHYRTPATKIMRMVKSGELYMELAKIIRNSDES